MKTKFGIGIISIYRESKVIIIHLIFFNELHVLKCFVLILFNSFVFQVDCSIKASAITFKSNPSYVVWTILEPLW